MNSNKIIISGLALLTVLSAGSCKRKDPGRQVNNDPVKVVAYTVKSESVVYYDAYPSTLAALNEIQLRSEVNGYVTGMYFREGGHVSKGEKLYEVDRRKYQAAYEAAKANVEIARTNLLKAQRDADRYQKLDDQNAIAKQTLDDGLTILENAKEQVKLASANLLNAETDFNYSLITAPFSGRIGFSSVKPGAFVTSGQTLLTTISSDDPIGADCNIDQKSLSYLLRLHENKDIKNDSVFKLVLPDNSDYKYVGKLSVIDRAIDPGTGTIKVRVVFPNSEGILRPGMNCNIKVINENSGIHVVIPASATSEQMSEHLVFLIDSGKVTQRKVSLGANLGRFVVVNEGLKDGDQIVLEGIQNVRQGTMVAVENSPKALPGAEP